MIVPVSCHCLLITQNDKSKSFQIKKGISIKQANSENLCPPPFFLRNTESSENVKFIGGFIHTRYILSTYVDSINA